MTLQRSTMQKIGIVLEISSKVAHARGEARICGGAQNTPWIHEEDLRALHILLEEAENLRENLRQVLEEVGCKIEDSNFVRYFLEHQQLTKEDCHQLPVDLMKLVADRYEQTLEEAKFSGLHYG